MKPNRTKFNVSDENGVNVKVIVRCRPSTEQEKKDPSNFNILQTRPETKEIVVSQQGLGRKIDSYSSKVFSFDGVCGAYTSQKELFKQYIVPIVDEALLGFNCTIFAYGQTGTGKTYTMEGDMKEYLEISNISLSDHAGIIPRAVQLIFERLESQYTEYGVRVSYLEIYNEELSDLLSDEKVSLKIYDDTSGKRGLNVDKLEEMPVNKAQDIFNILSTAVRKRRTAETLLNKCSSRSHCIFTITIHTKETNIEGEDVLKVGKLNLVDLAGSENIQRSGANAIKDRAKEAGMINQSLLTLGRVINALVDHSSYVPYRDSKLTRLLQDSLGGRTKTCIIATVTSSSLYLEETLNTLDYAHRAKNIKNMPVVNQKMTKKVMIREMNCEIERLKFELQANREKNGVYLPLAQYTEMECKINSQANEISELEGALRSQAEVLKQIETNLETMTQELDDRNDRINAGDYASFQIKKHALLYNEKCDILYSLLMESIKNMSKLQKKIIQYQEYTGDMSTQMQLLHESITKNIHDICFKTSNSFYKIAHEMKNGLLKQWLQRSSLAIEEIENIVKTGKALCQNVTSILDDTLNRSLNSEISAGISSIKQTVLDKIYGETCRMTTLLEGDINKQLTECTNIADETILFEESGLMEFKKLNEEYITKLSEYERDIQKHDENIQVLFNQKLNLINEITNKNLESLDNRVKDQISNLKSKANILKQQFNQFVDSFVDEATNDLVTTTKTIFEDINCTRDSTIDNLKQTLNEHKIFMCGTQSYQKILHEIQDNFIKKVQSENQLHMEKIAEIKKSIGNISSHAGIGFQHIISTNNEEFQKGTSLLQKISTLSQSSIKNAIQDINSVISIQYNSYEELSSCISNYFNYYHNEYLRDTNITIDDILDELGAIHNIGDSTENHRDTIIRRLQNNMDSMGKLLKRELIPSGLTPNKNMTIAIPKIVSRCLSPSKYINYYRQTVPRPPFNLDQVQRITDPFFEKPADYLEGDTQVISLLEYINNDVSTSSNTSIPLNSTDITPNSIVSKSTTNRSTPVIDMLPPPIKMPSEPNYLDENVIIEENFNLMDLNIQSPISVSPISVPISSIPKPKNTRRVITNKKINK
ncbi:kinesin motor domain-containing protein [Cryptosporidium muris RN66]|uniref:Kinesin motor domain-containing protein n=1 Tax=Cryptosporidium muris (strain RN66) TaxID=441375 RepID=B6AJ74_CRYMR|nr:kinesin motor domain-containing protein [Cryptosporidium muris RN66]EEA08311.1 kinesin motor domain-containing protein [Cryptosporidium muris RN66]|eukprot:XP_002142660.1 kinesin motor domain-containing protein [Cryptosporidium muris RN66]